MGRKKSKVRVPPPDYEGMWKAYQTDVLSLGRDVASKRAQAAASGRRLTGEAGEAFEKELMGFRDTEMANIKKGSAWKTLAGKFNWDTEAEAAEKYGTVEGYAPANKITYGRIFRKRGYGGHFQTVRTDRKLVPTASNNGTGSRWIMGGNLGSEWR